MKRFWAVIAATILIGLTGAPVLASVITGAFYKADLSIVNSSYDSMRVSVPFTMSTQSLLAGNYVNSSFTNVALQDSTGADMPFMPAQGSGTSWMTFLPQINQNSALNCHLYTGGAAMGGKLRYFPGDGGMTVTDNASLELNNNFQIEAKGYFDTSAGATKNVINKSGSCVTAVSGASELTTTLTMGTTLAPFSTTSDGQIVSTNSVYATAQAAATGTVTTNGNTITVGQSTTSTTQSQITGSGKYYMYPSSAVKAAERVNGFTGTIISAGFYLSKVGSPSGTITAKVWRASDGVELGTLGSMSSASLTGSAALYTFSSPVVVSSSTDVRIGIETTGGDGSNYVWAWRNDSDVSAWGASSQYVSSWTEDATYDLQFQITYISSFNVYRSFLYFDTSSIPVGAIITGATLNLFGGADNSTTDFNITVSNGQATYPHDPLVAGDFNKTNYSGTGGTLTTAGYSLAGYNALTLDATGKSWITKGGTTKLELASSRDISATTPSGDEYVTFYASDNTGTTKDPYLTITYTMNYSSIATGVTSGEHTIIVGLSGNTLTTTVDGVTKDTDTVAGSVVDNANIWTFVQNYSMPYVEYIKVTVGGVLKGHWYWQNALTFTDQSGNSNTATPTFRTATTDADVTAIVKSFNAADAAVFASADDDAGPEIVTSGDLPPVFAGFYINLHSEDMPGGPQINSFLDSRNIPYTAFWIPLVYLGGAIITMVGYRWTRKLLPSLLAGVVWNVFFGAVIGSGYWGLFVIGVVGVGEMINKKKQGV